MKKIITVILLSLFIFACSHKTVPALTYAKTSSATVTPDQFMEGKAVFEANCGKCHKLRNPASHTTTQWVKWLDKMAPKAKLSEEQKQKVYNFVSVNAKGS